jgi:hypothetical protein
VSVYVDAPVHRLGRMLMCHMLADSRAELLLMAENIGVATRWLQNVGEASEHFDVCKSKRALAVASGAVEVSSRQLVTLIRARRRATPATPKSGTEPMGDYHRWSPASAAYSWTGGPRTGGKASP